MAEEEGRFVGHSTTLQQKITIDRVSHLSTAIFHWQQTTLLFSHTRFRCHFLGMRLDDTGLLTDPAHSWSRLLFRDCFAPPIDLRFLRMNRTSEALSRRGIFLWTVSFCIGTRQLPFTLLMAAIKDLRCYERSTLEWFHWKYQSEKFQNICIILSTWFRYPDWNFHSLSFCFGYFGSIMPEVWKKERNKKLRRV